MLSDREFFLLPEDIGLLDYSQVFGNSNPVYVEIGSGKGEFISQYPILHPDSNFLGFEVRDKRVRNILKKLDPARHPNVRLVEELVDHRITERLPRESVHGIFIQHPDPWPKKRHFKRRLIQAAFLDAMASILMQGAFVQISTDHSEYANWIAEEFLRNSFYESVYDEAIQSKSHLEDHVITWFEQEQRRLGYEPNFMLFRKM